MGIHQTNTCSIHFSKHETAKCGTLGLLPQLQDGDHESLKELPLSMRHTLKAAGLGQRFRGEIICVQLACPLIHVILKNSSLFIKLRVSDILDKNLWKLKCWQGWQFPQFDTI